MNLFSLPRTEEEAIGYLQEKGIRFHSVWGLRLLAGRGRGTVGGCDRHAFWCDSQSSRPNGDAQYDQGSWRGLGA